MMTKAKRKTIDNNIVIICEGSDTEYLYFTEIKEYLEKNNPDRFSKIRILPDFKPKVETNTMGKKATRKLLPSRENKKYYALDDESYAKYKAQPIRYVREAQLFIEHEGYTEAWAVFDRDTYQEDDHKKAFELACKIKNLHIAFSSYCFEEWFLLHFEFNQKNFEHSECKDTNDKYIGCGTHQNVVNDCHGTKCIIGRLREQKYIEKYGKSTKGIFSTYTLPRLNDDLILPFFFAAKLKALDTQEPYKRNPYSNVDELVSRLLGNLYYNCCCDLGKELFVECDSTKLKCYKNSVNSICISNEGNVAFKYNEKKILSFISNQTSFSYLSSKPFKGVLKPGQSTTYSFQDTAEGVCITGKNNKIFFLR